MHISVRHILQFSNGVINVENKKNSFLYPIFIRFLGHVLSRRLIYRAVDLVQNQ